MTMPEKIWIDETSEDCDGFILSRYDQKYGNIDQPYIRADIAEELARALEHYDDGRDPVVAAALAKYHAAK